jgi:putative peptide zinc metalloprotease protein
VNQSKDYRIRDLGRTRITLRDDLLFTPRREGGTVFYVIEDPVRSRFYRVGLAEYTFLSMLDGKMTIAAALGRVAQALPQDAFSEGDAARICKWLVDAELAYTTESTAPGRLVRAAESADRRRRLGRLNPIFLRLPLLDPDRFLTWILPWTQWFYTLPVYALGIVLATAAVYQVAQQWDRFAAASVGILAPGQWCWVAMAWLLLKMVHETGHGIVCKKHGGCVREAGVLFVLLMPLAYIDVTSSWRFRSKWQRIHTAAAGMITEVPIGSLAALIWCHTPPGPLNQLCFSLTIMATAATLAFNANPLMRFDGYFILSDLLEIPNLYASGQQYLRYFGRRYLLGAPASVPSWPSVRGLLIRVYAFAALAWRVLVCAALVLAAAVLFHGAGIVLAMLAVVLWLGLPLARLAKYLAGGSGYEQPRRGRIFLSVAIPSAVLALVLTFVPWPTPYRAPAIVEYAPLVVVRARSGGLVSQVRVQTDQRVEQGDVLVVLENPELKTELADLEIALQQSRLKSRGLLQSAEMAHYQAERKVEEGLEKRWREKASEVDALTIRASQNGSAMGRDLHRLVGSYAFPGTQLLVIGNDRCKEVSVSIDQEDIDRFWDHVGMPVRLRLPGVGALVGQLTMIAPQASLAVPHPALAANAGGPLPVRSLPLELPEPPAATAASQEVQLLTPRFTGVVRLSPTQSARVRAGQRGTVALAGAHPSVGRRLSKWFGDWFRNHTEKPG